MPDHQNCHARVRRSLAAVALAAAVPLTVHAVTRADTPVLRFVIVDGHDVKSDGLGEYQDFRLLAPNDTANNNYCLELSHDPSLTFLFFNRDLDALGGAGSTSCEGEAFVARRQFYLHIDSAAACGELMSNNYGWSDDDGVGCVIHGYRNPRMRIDKLFGRRAQTTPIDFLIGRNMANPLDQPTYRIESDREATITVSGDTRTIDYGFSADETFRLVKVGTKTKGSTPAWALPFTMTLEMSFTVQYVTP